ncbi:MAG: hypothetical protein VZR11_05235 [Succinimonas sp.]|nr:hypothetical protein [Succinimonas sp.]
MLKTGDFKLDNQGNVVSGKPLTARRVRQIMNKALSMVSIAREKIDYDKYADKLKNMKELYKDGNPRISENLKFVDKCLKALQTSAENNETIIMKNEDKTHPDYLFSCRECDKTVPLESNMHFTNFFKATTGFRIDLDDKFTVYQREHFYDPSKLEKVAKKMVAKYHGGVKPPEYDVRDDMIREFNDKLIKYVRMTADLFEKCSEKGKLAEFEKVMMTEGMGSKYPVKYKITQLEGLQRNLLQA